ncbi:hypothetical protein R3W88_026608 [Solanum pinnatisectum]|uniref:Uncharacterized protein n=1 Tax=Solanum pinnatisectum TaxID=50273 RepID=A0AAV9LGE9_9SOLN|nr:hypothetical protein R3W88_026608 [Solanum pinnatisectum]
MNLSAIMKYNYFDSFDIEYAKDIPQQLDAYKDCGVLYRLMQYLSYNNGIPTTPLDSKLMRIRYAALLWDFVNIKIQFDAISDSEAPQIKVCHESSKL